MVPKLGPPSPNSPNSSNSCHVIARASRNSLSPRSLWATSEPSVRCLMSPGMCPERDKHIPGESVDGCPCKKKLQGRGPRHVIQTSMFIAYELHDGPCKPCNFFLQGPPSPNSAPRRHLIPRGNACPAPGACRGTTATSPRGSDVARRERGDNELRDAGAIT